MGFALAPCKVERPRYRRPASSRRSILSALLLLALPFSVAAESIDWNASGTPVNSFELLEDQLVSTAENTCDGSTVTATFSDPDGASRVGRGLPELRNGNTASSQALWWLDGSACNDEGIEVEIVFGGNAVENLAFSVSDIDATGAWTDEIVVDAEFSGALAATITCGDGATPPNCTSFTVDAPNNTALGDANNGTFDNPAGRADFVIAGPVQRLTIRYQASEACTQSGAQVSAISGFTFDCSALPVTLSSFKAEPTSQGVRFDWTTATEIENVGFNLYAEVNGEWQQLNPLLIPSQSFDSLVPQSYSAEFSVVGADRFALAEVDRRGKERLHGPYEANRQVGTPVEASPVNWGEVRREAERRGGVAPSLRSAPSALLSTPAGAQTGGVSMVDLQVTESGIHRVTYEDLAAAGFDLDGVAGSDLAIVNGRRVVPIRVVSPGEFFSVGDYFEFYGEELDTLFSSTNVYRLSARARHAKRVREITPKIRSEVTTSYVADRRIEENNLYSFASPVGDPWFDRPMLAFGTPLTESFEFEVDDLVSVGDLPELTVELWGVTDWPTLNPDHHVVATVNGVVVEDFEFDGLSDATFTVELPFDLLVDGTNTLELTLPADTGADFDLVHVEGYSIRYPRELLAEDDRLSFSGQSQTFSVDGLTEPDVVVYARLGKSLRRIANVAVESSGSGFKATFGGSGKRELAYEVSTESALLSPAAIVPSAPRGGLFGGDADYLIVSHSAFLDGLDPLIAAREADGYSVRVADVARVFSRYSGGIFDPEAIRDYVTEAVAEMGVEYVLLVGGDTYDYHDYLGVGSVSFIPTIYETTHAVVRYSPADSILADIDGDRLQDVAIGRFPVRTLDELETMIDKTLQYSPGSGTSVFAADVADGISSFSEMSDAMVESLAPEWSVDRAYIDDLGFSGARDALIDAFGAGAALVSYVGHSSAMSWTFDSLFTNGDALALENEGQPAVVLQWGCWSGYHSVPEYDTLSHSLLLGGPNGAAVVVGASTLTEASADEALALEMYPALMVPGQTVGGALVTAKRALAGQGGDFDDVLFGMTILGDPAVVVQP